MRRRPAPQACHFKPMAPVFMWLWRSSLGFDRNRRKVRSRCWLSTTPTRYQRRINGSRRRAEGATYECNLQIRLINAAYRCNHVAPVLSHSIKKVLRACRLCHHPAGVKYLSGAATTKKFRSGAAARKSAPARRV
jgi:hypothetical protein